MIQVSNLSKRYGSNLAVSDVSFSIKDGEIIGFLGPNGAGKSTIMNILTGYLSPTAGTVTVDGFDVLENPNEVKKRIGYLPELPPLYLDMTVREYLYFIYDLKKVTLPKGPHIDEICRLVKIEDKENKLIRNLSKGYRQRVGIAQALVGNPEVLILDEPTVGLDPKQIIEIRNLINHLGKTHTVIISSHILSEIQAVSERVLIINHGVLIADDTPENLSKNLSGNNTLTLRLSGKQPEVLRALSTVKGVKNVTSLGSHEKGTNDYLVEPENGEDIRAAVSNRILDRGLTVYKFSAGEMTLEQIFLRLTESADSGAEYFAKAEQVDAAENTEETEEGGEN